MDLLDWKPQDTHRHGETYSAAFDFSRLNAQQLRVYDIVNDGSWHTLREIADRTGDPEASVSARLRDLRNMFSLTVDRRRRGDEKRGLFEYRVSR